MTLFLLACAKPVHRSVVAGALTCAGCASATTCEGCSDPLELVGDVDLPGGAVRFDYQDVDEAKGHLIIAHMNDDSVDVINLSDGSLAAEILDIPTARGVVVAPEAGMFFVTSSPNKVVRIDSSTLEVVDRIATGTAPDGIGWDGADQIIGVSDQGDGAISLIPEAGTGDRTQIELGDATGNVVYDETRGWFWITVEHSGGTDQLVGIDPTNGDQKSAIDLPGCSSAHGLRFHPDAKSAFVACEGNNTIARVTIDSGAVTTGATTSGPDVLAVDPDIGWLYLAAEGGDVSIYDLNAGGVSLVGRSNAGFNAHTVAVDPGTHHVFFPLEVGPNGTPVLRIMKPAASTK